MKDRIKEIRKYLNLTQTEFATRIGINRGTLANYEVGRNIPIDSIILSICREFNVNEHWLRTGEGDMFEPLTRNDELAVLIGKFYSEIAENENDEDTNFKRSLIKLLLELEPEAWLSLKKYAEKLIEEMKNG